MTSLRSMFLLPLLVLALVLGACGDDDDSTSTGDDTSADSADGSDDTSTDDSDDSDDSDEFDDTGESDGTTGDDADDEEPPADEATTGGSGGGTATVMLDNGETFEFSILCALDEQEAAGETILFTVVSYDEPYNLDVTQFADDSFDGQATIGIYDAENFDTLWEASSGLGGSGAELSLDGSTITGTGQFLPAGEFGADPVAGELVANC